MSDYRSPSPTLNTSSTNIPPPLDISQTSSSSSRPQPQPHENAPSPHTTEGRSTTPASRPHSFVNPSHTANTARHRLSHTREEHSPDPRPRKKMRIPYSEERREEYDARSSPSLSSRSGNGDHETEGERSQQSETSTVPTTFEFAVPKKKRTRTLTTPHQAAVLHALLAQSRFPTTAMREEVGKQIGLSARKVQIWFQNQRQKARRPQAQGSQSAPSAPTQSPVYGPFGPTSASASASATSLSNDYYIHPHESSASHMDSSRPSEHPWASGQRRRGMDGRFLPPEDTPQTLAPGFWLAGPGMPGTTTSPQAGDGPSLSSGTPTPMQHGHALSYPSTMSHHSVERVLMRRHSQSPPRMREPSSRPAYLHMSGGDMRERFASRTLPPLVFEPSRPVGSPSPVGSANYRMFSTTRSAPSAFTSFDIPRNRSASSRPESPFSHHASELHSPLDLPLPHALQPLPLHDASYSSQSRPGTSWSRPSTSYSAPGESSHPIRSHERVVADMLARHQQEHAQEPSVTPRPSQMSRRFDPVHDSVSVNEAKAYSSASPTAEHSDTQDEVMSSR